MTTIQQATKPSGNGKPTSVETINEPDPLKTMPDASREKLVELLRGMAGKGQADLRDLRDGIDDVGRTLVVRVDGIIQQVETLGLDIESIAKFSAVLAPALADLRKALAGSMALAGGRTITSSGH